MAEILRKHVKWLYSLMDCQICMAMPALVTKSRCGFPFIYGNLVQLRKELPLVFVFIPYDGVLLGQSGAFYLP